MIKVLHIVEALSLGGGGRSAMYQAKYSARLGPYSHSIMPLSLDYTDPKAVELAKQGGMEFLACRNFEEQCAAIEQADIVQFSWWNAPIVDEFCRNSLPACRFIAWCHVAGDRVPQVITPNVVKYSDFTVAGSTYSYTCPAIQSLPLAERLERTGDVPGGTDFERLKGVQPAPHSGFNVGYVGTVNFLKMYENYVMMSAGINSSRDFFCGLWRGRPRAPTA